MDQEQIANSWNEFLEEERSSLLGESHFFKYPVCGTCKYWRLVDEDALSAIHDQSLYEHIAQGIDGKIIKAFKDDGSVVDTYSIKLFYGFCKRYPPQSRDTLQIADYAFPLLSHSNTCGEWEAAEEETDAQ